MKILMIMLSGVMVSNQIDKTQLESITKTQVVEQYKIIPKEVIQLKKAENMQKQVVAKKKATKKKVVKKKKSTQKRIVKKAKKKSSRQKRQAKKVVNKRGRYSVAEIQSYLHQLNNEYGWGEEDYYAWIMIVKRESSFNPYAINKKSKATGLCQALPGKKMASQGKDWRTNYKTQLLWCRDYIKNRYKTPSQAWSFWQSHHWF